MSFMIVYDKKRALLLRQHIAQVDVKHVRAPFLVPGPRLGPNRAMLLVVETTHALQQHYIKSNKEMWAKIFELASCALDPT